MPRTEDASHYANKRHHFVLGVITCYASCVLSLNKHRRDDQPLVVAILAATPHKPNVDRHLATLRLFRHSPAHSPRKEEGGDPPRQPALCLRPWLLPFGFPHFYLPLLLFLYITFLFLLALPSRLRSWRQRLARRQLLNEKVHGGLGVFARAARNASGSSHKSAAKNIPASISTSHGNPCQQHGAGKRHPEQSRCYGRGDRREHLAVTSKGPLPPVDTSLLRPQGVQHSEQANIRTQSLDHSFSK